MATAPDCSRKFKMNTSLRHVVFVSLLMTSSVASAWLAYVETYGNITGMLADV